MSTWTLTYRQSIFQWQRSRTVSTSFTHKMAAKTSWHRYGTKLRYCHPVCSIPVDMIYRFTCRLPMCHRRTSFILFTTRKWMDLCTAESLCFYTWLGTITFTMYVRNVSPNCHLVPINGRILVRAVVVSRGLDPRAVFISEGGIPQIYNFPPNSR